MGEYHKKASMQLQSVVCNALEHAVVSTYDWD